MFDPSFASQTLFGFCVPKIARFCSSITCAPLIFLSGAKYHYACSNSVAVGVSPAAVLASFPGSPNAVLVKLLRRMTSGGRLEAWLTRHTYMPNTAVHRKCHASRRPPDVILRTSFTRPSTALGDRRPGNEATAVPLDSTLASFPGSLLRNQHWSCAGTYTCSRSGAEKPGNEASNKS